MAKLDQLEQDLSEAEAVLNDADLQTKYNNLVKANEEIIQLVSEYEIDLTKLREDVDNIEDIKNALPDGCFKNIGIENPGLQ